MAMLPIIVGMVASLVMAAALFAWWRVVDVWGKKATGRSVHSKTQGSHPVHIRHASGWSSALMGAASIFDFGNTLSRPPLRHTSMLDDAEALAADWVAIGADLRYAMLSVGNSPNNHTVARKPVTRLR